MKEGDFHWHSLHVLLCLIGAHLHHLRTGSIHCSRGSITSPYEMSFVFSYFRMKGRVLQLVNFLLWKSAENINSHHMHTYLYCRDTVGVGMAYHVLPHVVVAVSSRSCKTELYGQLVTVYSGLTMSWYLVTAKREREIGGKNHTLRSSHS